MLICVESKVKFFIEQKDRLTLRTLEGKVALSESIQKCFIAVTQFKILRSDIATTRLQKKLCQYEDALPKNYQNCTLRYKKKAAEHGHPPPEIWTCSMNELVPTSDALPSLSLRRTRPFLPSRHGIAFTFQSCIPHEFKMHVH